MHHKIVQSYFEYLQNSDYNNIINLFHQDAIVISPLYGERPANLFYTALLADTQQSQLTLLEIFTNATGTVIAANFVYRWTLSDGTITTFDCVDIFELDEQGKIKQLKIIYDTAKTRPIFENAKAN
ncbi:MAG: nuclear transport factor 2 family protein [Saprospiraceae bacterium]